ncbi:MAG: SGNH/GDSL hydrolase family protein [Candidatus Marinimicrobia bacterium]|jgi:lysophospholipase L1-like esterase|nr:SGNH/GDSL hydrolase family protein [Candidatus Neomarinimicrobiota bacterium]
MKINKFKLIAILILLSTASFTQENVDWANLNRYKNENLELKRISNNSNRVIFMGNSITEVWIKNSPEFFKSNSYIGRGISGQTTAQMLIRFRADVVNLNPKVVVLLCGTNDIAGNQGLSTLEMIEDNIVSMTEIAKSNNIKVILCSVLPVYDYPWKKGIEPAYKIIKLNNWLKKHSLKNDIYYLDYFSSFVDKKNGMKSQYSYDGVHPNKNGYKIMESLVQKAIIHVNKNIRK